MGAGSTNISIRTVPQHAPQSPRSAAPAYLAGEDQLHPAQPITQRALQVNISAASPPNPQRAQRALQVKISSLALDRPTSRGSRCVPPALRAWQRQRLPGLCLWSLQRACRPYNAGAHAALAGSWAHAKRRATKPSIYIGFTLELNNAKPQNVESHIHAPWDDAEPRLWESKLRITACAVQWGAKQSSKSRRK